MDKKPKTIIFDFDGTIADSVGVFIDIARRISGSNVDIEASEIRSLRSLIKFGQRVNTPFWRFPVALAKVRSMVDKQIGEITPFDGIPEAIRQLHASGYQLFIVSTNERATIEKFLRLNELDSYFSGVYGSKKLVKSKTRSLASLLRRRGLDPRNCVFVGDENRDLEASRASGVPLIAVSWGFGDAIELDELGAAIVIDKPADLAWAISRL